MGIGLNEGSYRRGCKLAMISNRHMEDAQT